VFLQISSSCLCNSNPLLKTLSKILTFAISAQLLPASLIVFSLCSSAGVHGVFVLDFFAGGGPIGDEVVPVSTLESVAGPAELEGPDMVEVSMP